MHIAKQQVSHNDRLNAQREIIRASLGPTCSRYRHGAPRRRLELPRLFDGAEQWGKGSLLVSQTLLATSVTLGSSVVYRLPKSLMRSASALQAFTYGRPIVVVHEALRGLLKLTSESDPPLGQIRARIKVLPEQVVRRFDRLAPGQIPRYYEDVRNEPMPVAEEQALRAGGFRKWAQVADGWAVIWAVQNSRDHWHHHCVWAPTGGHKRSRARIEPNILGVARGAGNRASKGGRLPNSDFRLGLIGAMHEAWERATGTCPSSGRSDATGFGEAVHSIYQSLDRDGEAEYALRRFWEEFDKN